AAFRKEFESYANRINFIWLNDLSMDQMLEKTRALPPDSFTFLILLLRDATGVTHNADEALQRIHAVANAPINSIFQHQLGSGIWRNAGSLNALWSQAKVAWLSRLMRLI